ncbi:MAG: iron-regulated protein [Planctomycetes bacterium]|nr:iron-regulated protein [Planctomycetota bacterium]
METAAFALTALVAAILQSGPPSSASPPRDLRERVVRTYAEHCHRLYVECERLAGELDVAISALLERPDAETLAVARRAWIAARAVYVRTEALRFYDGPVDAIEGYLNAWPVDEAFIDYVEGAPASGIVNDAVHYPRLGETVLMFANEHGGEANICVGWHAIEFLLWGQDLRADGPGDRPVADYVLDVDGDGDGGVGRNATRRREYLQIATRLLRRQLGELASAWAPDADNYRRRFEADPETAVRKILTGVTILTAFELTGERLAVAYETQDQEQEHSCFSDTTGQDFEADQLGIVRVVRGEPAADRPGILALVALSDAALARALDAQLDRTLTALRAIPQPFDVAMRGADDAPGRVAIRQALEALEQQAELLTFAGSALGFELPLQPATVRGGGR